MCHVAPDNTKGYISFDANIWRAEPRTIEGYANIPPEKRRAVICGSHIVAETGSAELRMAIAAVDRILIYTEAWARDSDDILRSILSIAEFNWEDRPHILMSRKEIAKRKHRLQKVKAQLLAGTTSFFESQNRIRVSRGMLIPGNQDVFEKLRAKEAIPRSEKNRQEAFEKLYNFDLRYGEMQDACRMVLHILFAGYPTIAESEDTILTRLDQFVPLKRAMFVFLYQFYRQLIDQKRDESFICDWRLLLELPENGLLVTRDKDLVEAGARACFLVPVTSLEQFKMHVSGKESVPLSSFGS